MEDWVRKAGQENQQLPRESKLPIGDPPAQLIGEWVQNCPSLSSTGAFWRHLAKKASQWGANQQLKTTVKWLEGQDLELAQMLQREFHPKPSLKERVLDILGNHGLDDLSPEEYDRISQLLGDTLHD